MKTKNVRVKFQDIKTGRIIYVAHPVYGIERFVIRSKPYFNPRVGSHFVKVEVRAKDFSFQDSRSLHDMGIPSNPTNASQFYNGRRAFFKLRQAEEWKRKWIKDKGFQRWQSRHEQETDYMLQGLHYADSLMEEAWFNEHYGPQEEDEREIMP